MSSPSPQSHHTNAKRPSSSARKDTRLGKNPRITKTTPINNLPVYNRIRALMEHSTRYAFMGEARLSRDCGVSCATISRLITGKSSPSFALLVRITQAFEQQFQQTIDPREIVSLDGIYPTSTVCRLVGCRGCTPQSAWNSDDTLKSDTKSGTGSDREAR